MPVVKDAKEILKDFHSNFGKLLDLSETQMSTLRKKLDKEIDDWKNGSQELHQRLEYWANNIDNIIEESNWPFEGASNLHIPILSVYLDVYHTITKRSIMGTGDIWYAMSDDPAESTAQSVEEAMNYNAMNRWNIGEKISEALYQAPKDGLGILQIDYVIETERQLDTVEVTNEEEFKAEFPTPEDAGLSEEEYDNELQKIRAEASQEEPIEVPIEFDKVVYRGPKAELVELANFITFPANCRDISNAYCRGYGKRYWLRKGEIQKRLKEGKFYKEEVQKLLAGRNSGLNLNSYAKSRNYAQGFSDSGNQDMYELYDLVYRVKFKGNDYETKLFVTYCFDKKIILGCTQYVYRVDNMAFFRSKRKPNQLIGESLCNELIDMNDEVDTQHNQRINSRTITDIPSFKAKKSAKTDFDPQAMENQWRPGVIFWLDDPQAFDQFKVQPTDLGSSMQEEQNTLKICSMKAGVDPFLFSGSLPGDQKNSAAKKTMALISQSNLRMEDPISELRYGVEQVGDICLSHIYQLGDPEIDLHVNRKNFKPVQKKDLRNGVRLKMKGLSVALTPESEFMKYYNYYRLIAADPAVGNNPTRRLEMLRAALKNGRIPNREVILPEDKILMQEDNQRQAEIMLIKEALKEKELKKKALSDLKNAVQYKNAEAKMDAAMGGNGGAPMGE